MAKKTSIKVRLVPESKPDSPFFYYVKKPNSGDKAKVKLANRIRDQIDALDPNIKGDLAFIPNRLDKPMVGGVAFRGDDDENLKDMSLTHTCTGSHGVAFQKIVLNHQ